MAKRADFVWMDGEVVVWDDAKIHVSTEAVIRGENVFEGMRAYWNEDERELYIFKNAEHLRRLRQSAHIMRMTIPYTDEQLTGGFIDLIRRNKFTDGVHFRPVVYFAEGEPTYYKPDEIRTGVFVLAFSRPHAKSVYEGVHSCISTWRRNSDLASPSRIKAAANYHNSRLANVEARINGYGTPIMLNDRGKVAESPGSCIMLVRDGVVLTPPVTADILEGITRSTLIELFATELGLKVLERDIDRTEAYLAEEAFFCGSGQEVTPILSIDRYPLGDGKVGPITKKIQKVYFDIAKGLVPKYRHWLLPVYQQAKRPAAAAQ